MAGEALGLEISRGFRRSGLDVRIVTTDAAHLLLRGEISGGEEALTQAHGVIVLDVILVGRVVSRRWNLEDGDGAFEGLARTEILIGLPWLQDAHVAGLVTGHADVIGQLAAQMGRVDDRSVLSDLAFLHCVNMRSARSVTVLAADRGLREGRIAIASVMTGDRLRATAVTVDTARLDDAVEAVILVLITGREFPARGLRVTRERRLE